MSVLLTSMQQLLKHTSINSYRKTVVVGAGYIAVELAGILNALGSDTHNLIRRDHVLRNFDETVSEMLTEEMVKAGINLHKATQV